MGHLDRNGACRVGVCVAGTCGAADGIDHNGGAKDHHDDRAGTTVVVTISEDGRCYMMGPNCATHVAYSDGSVELRRTG